MPEIPPETIKSELQHYEDLLCATEAYRGTEEGKVHARDVFTLKGCLTRLGILTDEENHKLWNKARRRAEKAGRV